MIALPEVLLSLSDVLELFASAVAKGDFEHAQALAYVLLTRNDENGPREGEDGGT